MLKIVFMGCVQFSFSTLTRILTLPGIQLQGIVTTQLSHANSDYCSLVDIARERNLDLFIYQNNKEKLVNWIKHLSPDLIYCFGWPYLLSKDIYSIAKIGTIGYHPAALPYNRGRHPIIWSLVLGLKETASTFFFIDDGIDSGDILSQVPINITEHDNARSLYTKLTSVALKQITQFTQQFLTNSYKRIPQNNDVANYWRKRSPSDGIIDWRMPANSINNLVKALSLPYPGATCLYDSKEYKIWQARIFTTTSDNMEPGKIISNTSNSFVVKCGDNAIDIIEHEFDNIPIIGTYL